MRSLPRERLQTGAAITIHHIHEDAERHQRGAAASKWRRTRCNEGEGTREGFRKFLVLDPLFRSLNPLFQKRNTCRRESGE